MDVHGCVSGSLSMSRSGPQVTCDNVVEVALLDMLAGLANLMTSPTGTIRF